MRTRFSIVTVAVGLALALAACGKDPVVADHSAADALTQAVTEMQALTSVHISGEIAMPDGTISLDVDVNAKGDCAGTMTLPGGTARIISVDGNTYVKGDKAFWRGAAGKAAPAVMAQLGDKWASAGSASAQLAEFCHLDNFTSSLGAGTDVQRGETSTIDGLQVAEFTSEHAGGTTHAWVAVEGEPYLVRITREGEQPGTISFSSFNASLRIDAPAPDDVVTLHR